jgi:predicted Ser/Thr protein kinase
MILKYFTKIHRISVDFMFIYSPAVTPFIVKYDKAKSGVFQQTSCNLRQFVVLYNTRLEAMLSNRVRSIKKGKKWKTTTKSL